MEHSLSAAGASFQKALTLTQCSDFNIFAPSGFGIRRWKKYHRRSSLLLSPPAFFCLSCTSSQTPGECHAFNVCTFFATRSSCPKLTKPFCCPIDGDGVLTKGLCASVSCGVPFVPLRLVLISSYPRICPKLGARTTHTRHNTREHKT